MLVLNIGRGRFRTLFEGGFFDAGMAKNEHHSFSSVNVEQVLIANSHTMWCKPLSLPPIESKSTPLLLRTKEVAEKLNINYETARKLVNTHWLESIKQNEDGKSHKGVLPLDLEKFHRQFIFASALAKELGVNPTNLAEKLISIGIKPIGGPYIDKTPFNIYSRFSIRNICKADIDAVKTYQTRAGRRKNAEKRNDSKTTQLTLIEVAKQLDISPNKVAVLIHRGILTKRKNNNTRIIINKSSFLSLKNRLECNVFITIEEAARRLNCTLNWLYEYWCKSGFLQIVELVYWKLIRRSELNMVIKLKKEYLTGAEASALLGMPHSHITNLQKQGVIQPFYMGNTEHKVRLFKRKDVFLLGKQGYSTNKYRLITESV